MNGFDYETAPTVFKKKFDNFFLGFFVSAALTIVMLLVFSNMDAQKNSVEECLKNLYAHPLFTNYMIIALIPSMILFFILYKTERWQSGKGLIVAVLLSMVFLVLK